MGDLSDTDRITLIEKALDFCGTPVTREAVAAQFKYETGRRMVERKRHRSPKTDKAGSTPAAPATVRP